MAFSGTGHRLGTSLVDHDSGSAGRQVPSLVDSCLRVLERHIDMIDDIGVTPFHLIESVLRKCNVDQLSRIEHYTEGLDEFTDELWYLHAIGEFKNIRDEYPHYDQSGHWREIYSQRRKEEDEKFARVGAKLRQSYSQHDKNRQGRQVSFDPNLRLPKRGFSRPGGGVGSQLSGWGAPRKPKTLFEKAKLEARRTIQMFTPFPQNRSSATTRPSSSHIGAIGGRIRPPSAPLTPLRYPTSNSSMSTSSLSSSTCSSNPSPSAVSTNTSSSVQRTRTKYSYKTRPVVYTSLPGSTSHPPSTAAGGLSSPAFVTTTTTTTTANHRLISSKSPVGVAPSIPIPANANGAIANFFKELNPSSATGARHGTGSRSPTSPVQPASKTMEALRPRWDDDHVDMEAEKKKKRDWERSRSFSSSKQESLLLDKGKSNRGRTLQEMAALSSKKGDYRWLEEEDDDDDDGGGGDEAREAKEQFDLGASRRRKGGRSSDEEGPEDHKQHKRQRNDGSHGSRSRKDRIPSSSSSSPSRDHGHPPMSKPMTLEAAGRQFFNQLVSK